MPRTGSVERKGLVVAVDGPSGAGKSSTCMLLARRLGYRYIDTGAMYRAAALQAKRSGVSLEDREALERMCSEMLLTFSEARGGTSILLDGKDVSALIRIPGIEEEASRISRFPEVRRVMVQRQRDMGSEGGVVMEGRDIGSVVFPDADVKIFLDASVEARAKRRCLEWEGKGVAVSERQVFNDMQARDHRDRTREIAPLQVPEGALTIDTTQLTLEEVVTKIMEVVESNSGRIGE